ncbi:MAG TPA: S-layer protein, partial [Verrucomicrobiales bacterium]|nr:S-layer protein [Verrucomicrobiales bacterium]
FDLTGLPPTPAEVAAFSKTSYEAQVDRLLASPHFGERMAMAWLDAARYADTDGFQADANRTNWPWRDYVIQSFNDNKPFDQFTLEQFAGDLLPNATAEQKVATCFHRNHMTNGEGGRDKEESRVDYVIDRVNTMGTVWMGLTLGCTQCHSHKFDPISQHDYYSLSAFFSQVGRKPTAIAGEDLIFHKRGIAQTENKKTRQPVKPAALGSDTLDIPADEDPRLKLADWMSQPSNPFFAKSLTNRYWKHFFKRGLVEPEDDIRDTNPATNPELLDALAKHFIESGFDLKAVVRVITQSHTYQLSAMPNEHNAVDRQNFSHYYPKRMQAEVLLDAMDLITGAKSDFADLPPGTRAISLPDNSYNRASAFLKVFGRPEGASVCECERVQSASLAQSLHLMNASDVKAKLVTNNGRADVLSKAEMPEPKRIRELYLAAFSREPTADEVRIAESHVAKPRADAQGKALDTQRARRQGYEDLIWALLNTKEFLYNH